MLELLRVPNEELLLEKLFYPSADSTRSIAGDAHPKFQVDVVSKEWE